MLCCKHQASGLRRGERSTLRTPEGWDRQSCNHVHENLTIQCCAKRLHEFKHSNVGTQTQEIATQSWQTCGPCRGAHSWGCGGVEVRSWGSCGVGCGCCGGWGCGCGRAGDHGCRRRFQHLCSCKQRITIKGTIGSCKQQTASPPYGKTLHPSGSCILGNSSSNTISGILPPDKIAESTCSRAQSGPSLRTHSTCHTQVKVGIRLRFEPNASTDASIIACDSLLSEQSQGAFTFRSALHLAAHAAAAAAVAVAATPEVVAATSTAWSTPLLARELHPPALRTCMQQMAGSRICLPLKADAFSAKLQRHLNPAQLLHVEREATTTPCDEKHRGINTRGGQTFVHLADCVLGITHIFKFHECCAKRRKCSTSGVTLVKAASKEYRRGQEEC